MCVTDNMISNTVTFNVHRANSRSLVMQTQLSFGRRINRSSDDPGGTIRDLNYRAELSKNAQYQSSIDQGLNWMGTYKNDLSDINNMYSNRSLMIENLDNVKHRVLNQRASVTAKSLRMESTGVRLTTQELSFTKLLSDVEDADLTKLLTDLATFENNYQAALRAGARIVQPALLAFMR